MLPRKYVTFALFILTLLTGSKTSAFADEIRGQVGAVDEKQVAIVLEGDLVPQTGDKFTIVVEVPDVGNAQIAEGVVTQFDNGIAIGEITKSTGKVTTGQLAIIDSPNAIRQTPPVVMPPAESSEAPMSPPAKPPTIWVGLVVENYLDDVRINDVIPSAPAYAAGLQRDDRLISVNGRQIKDFSEVSKSVQATPQGQKCVMELERQGRKLTIEVVPEPMPSDEQKLARLKSMAEAGDIPATYHLALEYDPSRTEENLPTAEQSIQLLQKAADAGYALAQHELGRRYLKGDSVTKDEARGVELTRQAAAQGLSNALWNMAIIYHNGWGVEKNETEARQWCDRALATGRLPYVVAVGQLYESGEVYPLNVEKALELYRKAAHRDSRDGGFEFGRCLMEGQGIAEDRLAAEKWLTKALDAGNFQAAELLGVLYQDGIGVSQDHQRAVSYFRQGAAAGDLRSTERLAIAYGQGKGVQQDDAEAARWYRIAADGGLIASQVNLGWAYEFGKGVPQSDTEAAVWYRKAAEGGNDVGQFNLATLYLDGRGVAKNEAEAMKWCHLAAKQKYPRAENHMGLFAYHGWGAPKNLQTAFSWYKLAAEHGDLNGQYNVGYMYEFGEGVSSNLTEAINWYRRSAGQGYQPAKDALIRLGVN